MECHAQLFGDDLGLVRLFARRKLLQSDDIRIVPGNDRGDPVGLNFSVPARAAVNVISHDPQDRRARDRAFARR